MVLTFRQQQIQTFFTRKNLKKRLISYSTVFSLAKVRKIAFFRTKTIEKAIE